MTEKINWVKIVENNREKIEEAIRLAKEEAFNCMSGWRIDVEINQEGEVWTGGPASYGSQSMSSFNGETFIVAHINSWTIESNESEDIKYHEDLYAEFLAQQDDEDGYEYAWEFMENKYPEIRQEWHNDAKDFELSEFDAGEVLDRAIEELKEYEQFLFSDNI